MIVFMESINKSAAGTAVILFCGFILFCYRKKLFAEFKRKAWIPAVLYLILLFWLMGGLHIYDINAPGFVSGINNTQTIQTEVNKIPIDDGIEVRTDLNGDGETDKVRILDVRSGDDAFAQVIATVGEKDITVKNYDGYFASKIYTGDLTANGSADVLVIRQNTASIHESIEFSVLHIEEDRWAEYPCVFLKNPSIEQEQPKHFKPIADDGFSEYQAGSIYSNAAIIQ